MTGWHWTTPTIVSVLQFPKSPCYCNTWPHQVSQVHSRPFTKSSSYSEERNLSKWFSRHCTESYLKLWITVPRFSVLETSVCTGGAPLVEWGENRGEKEMCWGHAAWKERREEKKELGEGTIEIQTAQISFLCIEYKHQTGNICGLAQMQTADTLHLHKQTIQADLGWWMQDWQVFIT